jgi:hypothetical protein
VRVRVRVHVAMRVEVWSLYEVSGCCHARTARCARDSFKTLLLVSCVPGFKRDVKGPGVLWPQSPLSLANGQPE